MTQTENAAQPADEPTWRHGGAAADDALDACKQRSQRLYEEIFGKGNYAAADELMSPDIINHGPGTLPVTGTAGIKQQAERLRAAIPDLRITLHDQFGEGDKVVCRWTGSGTHSGPMTLPTGIVAATGNLVSFDEIRIDRHSGGKIAESWWIPDRFTLWAQLGLLPPGGPAAAQPPKDACR